MHNNILVDIASLKKKINGNHRTIPDTKPQDKINEPQIQQKQKQGNGRKEACQSYLMDKTGLPLEHSFSGVKGGSFSSTVDAGEEGLDRLFSMEQSDTRSEESSQSKPDGPRITNGSSLLLV